MKRMILIAFLFLTVAGTGAFAFSDLSGRVEDGSGNPLHEARVEVLPAGESRVLNRAMTDHEGKFQFSNLPPGDLELVVRMGGFETATLIIPAEKRGEEVLLRLVSALPPVATEVSVFAAVPRTAASSSVLRSEELTKQVIIDPGDVLRIVPGLTVVQHAGGGKANQYLLRGFDTDHGTDFAVSFAGIPVNMVSHAHGQGYADLNFVIPEVLESVNVYKGPYFAELGNLATAGAAVLGLREEFDHSFVKLQGGQFDSARILAGLSPDLDRARGFLALEGNYTNGPFLHPQTFRRVNVITRWTVDLPSSQTLSLLGTGYGGKWNQSGQIPLREVRAGRLDRFGSIDPSEGGDSSRYNFSVSHQKLWANQALNSQFYSVFYDLDLFSNFTFYRGNPNRGDGIKQSDRRWIIGGHVQHHHHHELGSLPSLLTMGLDYRQDSADIGLFHQEKRRVFDTILNSHVNERNLSFYIQEELELHPTLKTIVGLRHDRFRFDVEDLEAGALQGIEHRDITGPKLSFIYSPRRSKGPELYLNYGRGFHSNDARSVVANPRSVALAAADGYEIGYRQLLEGRLELDVAYWLLDLEGELVFVGDEGTTELRGPTRRHGPEAELKWHLSDSLWLDAEASYSWSGFRETGEVIPRAPRFVTGGGLSFTYPRGLSGHLRVRHVGSHPLVENNTVQAEGFTVTDFFLEHAFTERWAAILTIENLFDAEVKEAQTFFESRLPFEPVPVGDNHFNPGNPFTLQLGIRYRY